MTNSVTSANPNTNGESFPFAVRNTDVYECSPSAAYEFARAALERDGVVGVASGICNHRLYVWAFLPEIDVPETRALFSLQASIEQRLQGTFEVHVDALQGRELSDAVPKGFQLMRRPQRRLIGNSRTASR
jgi:hypothetical protein